MVTSASLWMHITFYIGLQAGLELPAPCHGYSSRPLAHSTPTYNTRLAYAHPPGIRCLLNGERVQEVSSS